MESLVVNQNNLYDKITSLIDAARSHVKTVVNTTMVYTYYEIGKHIVEHEQQGNSRAEYGKNLIKNLAERLTAQYGKGWTSDNLKLFRRLYLVYSNRGITDSPIQNDRHCLSNLTLTPANIHTSTFTTPRFQIIMDSLYYTDAY